MSMMCRLGIQIMSLPWHASHRTRLHLLQMGHSSLVCRPLDVPSALHGNGATDGLLMGCKLTLVGCRLTGQDGHHLGHCFSTAHPEAAGPQVAGHRGGCHARWQCRLCIAGWVRSQVLQHASACAKSVLQHVGDKLCFDWTATDRASSQAKLQCMQHHPDLGCRGQCGGAGRPRGPGAVPAATARRQPRVRLQRQDCQDLAGQQMRQDADRPHRHRQVLFSVGAPAASG